MDDILKEFIIEAREHLGQIETDLVVLEANPTSSDIIARIFRGVHTIKGAAGFLGLKKLEALTHSGENLLVKLRDGHLKVNNEIIDVLLALADGLRKSLEIIEQEGSDAKFNHTDLVLKINRIYQKYAELQNKDQTPTPGGNLQIQSEIQSQQQPLSYVSSQQPVSASSLASSQIADGFPTKETEQPVSNSSSTTYTSESISSVPTETHVRVNVELLDRLMNLVGELVLVRNRLLQSKIWTGNDALMNVAQTLDLVTTELQEEVMRTRLQPIRNAWSKLPRMVRDLSQEMGKKVKLVLEGQETELDRAIIEAIKDPMVHLVRNALDHGIEPPAERKKLGKPELGIIKLKAYHEGGQVTIEVSDDGKGINPERIRSVAVAKNLISAEKAATLTAKELYRFLFYPGFSTAEKVTNISGRGVGMDVVKTNVERLGGSVDVESELGKGTTIKLKIPLTLAIIPALLIESAGQILAIPRVNLVELVRYYEDENVNKVYNVKGRWVFNLRGQLLPLVILSELLAPNKQFSGSVHNIVIIQAGPQKFGLVVDKVYDTCEIVVKPLSKHLKHIPIFAGATILGDGTVALILDLLGLAQQAAIAKEKEQLELIENIQELKDTQVSIQKDGSHLLLVRIFDEEFGVDLSTIGRLERFNSSKIEKVGDRYVVQYSQDIMDLIPLNAWLGYKERFNPQEQETIEVIVHNWKNRWIGLIVDKIQDIVIQQIQLDETTRRKGILGRCVVQGKIIQLLDPVQIIETYEGSF